MDPDANLNEQRQIVARIHKIADECPADGNYTARQLAEITYLAGRLADLVEALDDWITGGGFLPQSWRRQP